MALITTNAAAGSMGVKTHSQVDNRHDGNFGDQHGRAYFATCENKTGDPAGAIQMSWRAPNGKQPGTEWAKGKLNPPSEFLRILRTDTGKKCLVDYDGWLRAFDTSDRNAKNFRDDLIRAEGTKKGMSAEEIGRWIDSPPAEYLKISSSGAHVLWPRAFIVAAMRGNKWCLGLADVMPAWAAPIMESWRKLQPTNTRVTRDDDNEYPDADEGAPLRLILSDSDEAPDEAYVPPEVPRPTAVKTEPVVKPAKPLTAKQKAYAEKLRLARVAKAAKAQELQPA